MRQAESASGQGSADLPLIYATGIEAYCSSFYPQLAVWQGAQ